MYYIVGLFVLNINHVALKILFEYFRKIEQDPSMTQSPTNLVPMVSWPSEGFDSADSVFFSTIKTKISKSQGTLGDKVDCPIFTANGSYSYSHI